MVLKRLIGSKTTEENLSNRIEKKNREIEKLKAEKKSLLNRIEHMESLLEQARSKFENEDKSS